MVEFLSPKECKIGIVFNHSFAFLEFSNLDESNPGLTTSYLCDLGEILFEGISLSLNHLSYRVG